MPLKRFNQLGIEEFRGRLRHLRSNPSDDVPSSLLSDGSLCEEIDSGIDFEQRLFQSKEDIVRYISSKMSKISNANLLYDSGLWTWLSAFYFDSVCPKRDGVRKLGEDSRYILNSEEWNKYYRHLLASPTRLFWELGELARIYLVGPPDKNGDLLESLASRQEIATCKGVIEAATALYWDETNHKIKVRARNKEGKGVLRRFVTSTIPQFQMTYDLNSMSGAEIIELLPNEYEVWLTPSVKSRESHEQ